MCNVKGFGGIRFIFELPFAILIGDEQHLARRVHRKGVQLVRLDHLFRTDVAQSVPASVKGVLARQGVLAIQTKCSSQKSRSIVH